MRENKEADGTDESGCVCWGACTGFDRDLEDGEAIRRLMRQIAKLKLNANDNFELAAA